MGYLLLVLCAFAYGVGIVAQSAAARRSATARGLDAGLLVRLVRDRVYLAGLGAQVLGFVLAFYARASLPLYLVQAGATSAVAVSAVLGALLLRWRVRPLDIGVIIAMGCGLALLVGAAEPATSDALPPAVGVGLLALLGLVGGLAVLVARRGAGDRRTVALGLLSGTAFAVLAIAGRPIAALPFWSLPLQWTAWLMVLAALVGQVLQVSALQNGSSTAAMAPSYAMSTVLASIVGLLVLGDGIAPGRAPWVLTGLLVVVAGVVALSLGGSAHPEVGARSPVEEERALQ